MVAASLGIPVSATRVGFFGVKQNTSAVPGQPNIRKTSIAVPSPIGWERVRVRASRPRARSIRVFAVAALVLLLAGGARAETTDALSKAEIEGRELARQIREAKPSEDFRNLGTLQIRDGKGVRTNFAFRGAVNVTESGWLNSYVVVLRPDFFGASLLEVAHATGRTNQYNLKRDGSCMMGEITGKELFQPFGNSDFWLCDLGLEFFHWPAQKILKKEVKRSRGCTVLESTNSGPATNGYSRVVSWIDHESGGIVQAEAYDFKNKLLKEFEPKSFKKVAGQWQLQEMEIRNVQTGSRTRLEFDLGAE